ncbi:MAG: hypothetical protein E7183_05230 [Erysipelotrichaceae bacterium]|nr:hypothetical protein [Erysipelotrichaceae bacterium]
MKKESYFTWIPMVFVLLIMFTPACKVKSDYSVSYYYDGTRSSFSFNGKIGSIYDFIFGADDLGKYGLESVSFNPLLFIGFFSIIIAIIICIINFSKDIKALKLIETISIGISTFFLSPIFSYSTVMKFYQGLPEHKRLGTYADYRNFKFGGSWYIVFFVLLGILIYNIIALCKCQNKEKKATIN